MIYNIYFDIAALVILILCYIMTLTSHIVKGKEINSYRALIIVTFFSCALDIVSAECINHYESVDPTLNLVLATLYFIGSIAPLACAIYSINAVVKKLSKLVFVINFSIVGVYVICLIINAFTGFLFSFNNAGAYVIGPLYILNFAFPILSVIYILVVFGIKHKEIEKRKFHGLLIFVILFVIGCALQAILKTTLLLFFASSIAIGTLFFSLETPNYHELQYLRKNLELEVDKKTSELKNITGQTIEALALTIDSKDKYTRGHSLRVANYSRKIAEALGLSSMDIETIYNAALLHDIGKIGIPDSILLKPGKLTPEEFEIIKSHTITGHRILSSMDAFKIASDVARHHHEKWNGLGYPDGLSGDDISLVSRIVGMADAFDAMNSNRAYRSRLTKEEIRNEIISNSGTQFDPEIAELFLKLWDSGAIEVIKEI